MSSSEENLHLFDNWQALFLSESLKSIWSDLRPDPELVSPQCCATLLLRKPGLRDLVDRAYTKADPNILKDSADFPQHPRAMIYYREEFCKVLDSLEGLREPLGQVADGTAFEPSTSEWLRGWAPSDDDDDDDDDDFSSAVLEHIQKLEIPHIWPSGEPLLVLHEYGRFQSDSQLNERLEHIFAPNENTFLVNASGTGKTRLLYEGLCKHWGFYFTAAVDTSRLGSTDVQSDIKRRIEGHPVFMSMARDRGSYSETLTSAIATLAHRCFSEILLARLLVFKSYLEIVTKGGIEDIHKTRWFLVQLQPYLVDNLDSFAALRSLISASNASDIVIDECIAQCMEDVTNSFLQMSPEPHFFIVLDEANVVSERDTFAFRGVHGPHPILKEIIQVWHSHLQAMPASMVIAGTCIPDIYYKDDEWMGWRWVSSTGAFDNIADQRNYVLKYLPPSFASSPSGKNLVHRIWCWLRGRHRATAAFLETLVETGFQSPHSRLNWYIHMFTGFWPSESARYIQAEPELEFLPELDGIPVSHLERSPELCANLHHLLLQHLIADYHFNPSPFREIAWVTSAFGHFIDNTMSNIAVDEPLMLVAVAQWLSEQNSLAPNFDRFMALRSSADNHLLYGMDYVIFALALCFNSTPKLSSILSFATRTPPHWAAQQAHLVALRKKGDSVTAVPVQYSPEIPSQLVFCTSLSSDVLGWLEDSKGVPFCLHATASMATLYFILELHNHMQICVALQLCPDADQADGLDIGVIQATIDAMTPSVLLNQDSVLDGKILSQVDEEVPMQFWKNNSVKLLRILVSLETKLEVQDIWPKVPSQYPIASLNISVLREAVENIPQEAILHSIVASIVGDFKTKPIPYKFQTHTKRNLPKAFLEDPPSIVKSDHTRLTRSKTALLKNLDISQDQSSQDQHLLVSARKKPRVTKVTKTLSRTVHSRYNLRKRK
ncbi:hypothetical protein FB446DRAFT_844988 [Lentinula raphanica]|nr:hypothetical protein FB446DRAFT_844988 [Lentinula raphanica]